VLSLCQLNLELGEHPLCDLILYRKNSSCLPVESIRPQVMTCYGVYQLRGNASLIPGFLHTPFQHVLDA
jgi:hypothetical protein